MLGSRFSYFKSTLACFKLALAPAGSAQTNKKQKNRRNISNSLIIKHFYILSPVYWSPSWPNSIQREERRGKHKRIFWVNCISSGQIKKCGRFHLHNKEDIIVLRCFPTSKSCSRHKPTELPGHVMWTYLRFLQHFTFQFHLENRWEPKKNTSIRSKSIFDASE